MDFHVSKIVKKEVQVQRDASVEGENAKGNSIRGDAYKKTEEVQPKPVLAY